MQESNTRNKFTMLTSNVPWAESFSKISKYTNSLNDNKLKQEKTVKKKKKINEILYPVFKEMAELSDDFWKSKFNSYAIGKFGKGFQYNNNVLTYKCKNKPITVEIDDDQVEKSMKLLLKFLNEKVGIISPEDEDRIQTELKERNEKMAKIEIKSWSQFKKESHISNTITVFIDNFNDGMDRDLTVVEKKKLEDTIRKGIVAGYFNSTNIIINDGMIEKINGLIINNINDTYNFSINKIQTKNRNYSSKEPKYTETTLINTTNEEYTMVAEEDNNDVLHKQWVKFLKGVNKKVSKYNN